MRSTNLMIAAAVAVVLALAAQSDGAASTTRLDARWGGSVVPYEIANSFSQEDRDRILLAFAEIESKTCIRFVPRTNQFDAIRYANVASRRGCSSETIGRKGGRQFVFLNSQDCFNRGEQNFGTALSQTCLALGLTYEHNRPDRRAFIDVRLGRLDPLFGPGVQALFEQNSEGGVGVLSEVDYQGTEYDYGSIMHFGETDFARPGRRVIIPKRPVISPDVLGQREGLSVDDALGLNRFYGCPIDAPLRNFSIRIRRARNLPFGTATFVRVAAFNSEGRRTVLVTSSQTGTNINFQETLDFGLDTWAYFRIQIKNAPGRGNFFTTSETIGTSNGSLNSRHCVLPFRRSCQNGQVTYQSRFTA